MSRFSVSNVLEFMDQAVEALLVSRLQAGDASAFDEVHALLNTRLFNFLLRLSRRREVAEDLLEETWLRLVTHANRLRPDTRLAAWLFTVARNLYVGYQRSRMLEETHATSLIGLWPGGAKQLSPFEETATNETERRIEAGLAALPAAYREVLLLVGVEGFRPVEAAKVCGISPEALRQRLSRARALLTRQLEAPADTKAAAFREVTT
ncbi:MAG TPA: RNA polymerase sigma factor [Vicinamibacterales bacterium]|nr:RNA polymerase sigma factor [Vicinamibacterales bacterium]